MAPCTHMLGCCCCCCCLLLLQSSGVRVHKCIYAGAAFSLSPAQYRIWFTRPQRYQRVVCYKKSAGAATRCTFSLCVCLQAGRESGVECIKRYWFFKATTAHLKRCICARAHKWKQNRHTKALVLDLARKQWAACYEMRAINCIIPRILNTRRWEIPTPGARKGAKNKIEISLVAAHQRDCSE